MELNKEYYSPDEVAELLDLHVRTVRRYIREGRLKASRIGKQYRIAAADLSGFVGTRGPESPAVTVHRHRRALVSATVDIDAISPDEAYRITTGLTAVFASTRGKSSGKWMQSIYYEEQGRLRVVVNAELGITNGVLGMIQGFVTSTRDDEI